MALYKITTDDFATQEGVDNIITVRDGIIYLENKKALKAPFEKITALPEWLQAELDAIAEKEKAVAEVIAESEKQQLQEYKEKAKDELELQRATNCQANVEYKGFTIQASQADQNLIANSVLLLGETDKIKWICADNTITEFTGADLKNIALLISNQVSQEYIRVRLLKDKLLAATTKDEVDEIMGRETQNKIQSEASEAETENADDTEIE